MKQPQHINVEQLTPHIGAVISGLNLGETLTTSTIDQIRRALLRHHVVFFRDQDLTPEQLMRFAARFGVPVPYPMVNGITGYPCVVEVLKLPHEQENFGGVWHSDTPYLEAPAMAAMLYAVEVPKVGGDTLFANMISAYEALSPGLAAVLSQLRAVNDADKAAIARSRMHRIGNRPTKNLKATHPVIRLHPETGEKLLYVSRAHTTRFEDMTEQESTPLLEFLYAIQSSEAHTCRFKWTPGSLAFWDNRACQHYPLNDYHGEKRLMYRISLGGDKPLPG